MPADNLAVAVKSSDFIQSRGRALLFPDDAVKRAFRKKIFISTAIQFEKNFFSGADRRIRKNHVRTNGNVTKKVACMNRCVFDSVQLDVVLCECERTRVDIIEMNVDFRVPIGDKKTDRAIPAPHVDDRVDIRVDRDPFEQKATPLIEGRLAENTMIGRKAEQGVLDSDLVYAAIGGELGIVLEIMAHVSPFIRRKNPRPRLRFIRKQSVVT